MYYEINVTKNKRHFFATAERSLHTYEQAKAVYLILKEKFPESEGYEITVSYCEKTWEQIEIG